MKLNPFLLAFLMLCFLSVQSVSAQSTFQLPENIEFKTSEDYIKYEPTFVEAAKWLEDTDLDKEQDKRQKINAFIIQYLTGSPSISIEISTAHTKLSEGNEQFLLLYMAGFGKSAIENNKDKAKKYTFVKAGINSILKVYKKGIGVKKNAELEKLLKMNDAKLDKYITKNF
jgi:hypothetical protein